MKHTGTVNLETKDLLLRRFEVTDAEAMYKNYANDPEVTKFLTWPVHENARASAQLLAAWVEEYADPSVYNWAIVDKALGEVIGGISIVKADETVGMLHVGYCLGRAFWHRGYMTQALTAVRDHLFREVGIDRLEARHDPNNPHSGAVMRKCAMVYEGTLRRSGRNNQGIVDEAYYGLLREEWERLAE